MATIMTGGPIRATAVEIDLGALSGNARSLADLAATALYAVVKADGYGHGAPAVVIGELHARQARRRAQPERGAAARSARSGTGSGR